MAVIAPFREANELDVLTKARQLAEYIFTICKNEKQFPRRDRWMLTADILHEAAHVLAHVRRANAVRVTTAEDYTQRRSEQVAALSSLDALMGYADLAYTVLHLSGDRAEYWTGLMVEEMALLKGRQPQQQQCEQQQWRAGGLCAVSAASPSRSGASAFIVSANLRRNQNNAHTRSGRPARSIRGIQGRKTGRRRARHRAGQSGEPTQPTGRAGRA